MQWYKLGTDCWENVFAQMRVDAGGQVERKSAVRPSSGWKHSILKLKPVFVQPPERSIQLLMDVHRDDGARGFLEVHSKGMRGNGHKRQKEKFWEICLDVRKKILHDEGGQMLEKSQRGW